MEESVSNFLIQNKGPESDETSCPANQPRIEDSNVELIQGSTKANVKEKAFMYPQMILTEESDLDSLHDKELLSVSEKNDVHCHHVPNLTKTQLKGEGNNEEKDPTVQQISKTDQCDSLAIIDTEEKDPVVQQISRTDQCDSLAIVDTEEKDPVVQQISRTDQCDSLVIANTRNEPSFLNPGIVSMKISETASPQKSAADIEQDGDSNQNDNNDGGYFYYDTPHHEDTGIWIPVSIPPLSEREHDEWTKGFCSNGGYIPDDDLGWSQYIGEDKELTMWDVVLDMLLAARGKMTAIASGDICQLTWMMSTNLIEQAWSEMAQTLTDANLSCTQEILESEPPKWLPDSTASSCMLCSVRFHPFMCTRHHCRYCGGIFCNSCTKGRSLLPEKFRSSDPQRVCDVCYVRLESVQPYLVDRISCAAQLPTHDLTDLSTLRSWVNFPWVQSMENEIYKATNTIRGYSKVGSLRPEKRIPENILQNAKGLAILTLVKVGMMVTYNIGTGLVVARRDDGSWSPPSAISTFGLGWGVQAGGELTDFVIVLRTKEAVKTFCSDTHLSVGAGLSAAIGIIGRTAEADVRAGPTGIAACYTYSSSKGAFIGCSLEGSIVTTRTRENSRFYGSQSITASDIVCGSLPRPPAAATLYRALDDLYMQLKI